MDTLLVKPNVATFGVTFRYGLINRFSPLRRALHGLTPPRQQEFEKLIVQHLSYHQLYKMEGVVLSSNASTEIHDISHVLMALKKPIQVSHVQIYREFEKENHPNNVEECEYPSIEDFKISKEHHNARPPVRNFLLEPIDIEELRPYFSLPIAQVSKRLGICTTLLKKLCRKNGIKRWPHRQMRSILKSIRALRNQIDDADDEGKYSISLQLTELERKRQAVLENPNLSTRALTKIGDTKVTNPNSGLYEKNNSDSFSEDGTLKDEKQCFLEKY